MLYWICPECGRECQPALRECPACSNAAQSVAATSCVPPPCAELSSTTEGVLALARSVQESPPVLVLESIPEPVLVLAKGRTGGPEQLAFPALETARALPFDESVESVVRPLVESARIELPPPIPILESVHEITPELPAPAEPELPAELAQEPVEQVADAAPEAIEETEPAPPIELEATAIAVQAAQALAEAVEPDPAPVEDAPVALETVEAAPVLPPVSSALELHSFLLLEVIDGKLTADESGIRAILESFAEQPLFALLAAPAEIVEAPAPPILQRMATPRPSIPAKAPGDPNLASLSVAPQPLTLAGPCLPRELQEFVASPASASRPPAKRSGVPAWIISLVVATTLFLGGASALQYLTGNRDAKATPTSAGSAAASVPGEVHTLARFVEVTGLRVIADLKHRSQVHYIVVNHSSSPLSGVTLRIAVRSSAGSSDDAPLFSVSTVIANLAPYQSKEIRADLDNDLRAAAIPEWQNLRTDVQVISQSQ